AIEDERVRIACGFIRHRDLLDVARRRIESADVRVAVPGVPDDARVVDDEVVRQCPIWQLVLTELAGSRVQHPYVVALLADEPDLAVAVDVRIAWARVVPRDRPFADVER